MIDSAAQGYVILEPRISILANILDFEYRIALFFFMEVSSMPQISLYIDNKTLTKVQNAAKKQHTSISKWVAEQLRMKIDPSYPAHFEELFGAIKDATFQEPEEIHLSADLRRETL